MELSTTLIIVGVIILLLVGIVLFVVFSDKESVHDNKGVAEWATNIQGIFASSTQNFTDKDGNIYVVGFYQETITINNYVSVTGENVNVSPYGTLTNSGSGENENIYLVKYNSSGKALWATSLGGNLFGGNSMITDTFGNVYVTGAYTSNPLTINSFGSVSGGTINVSPYGTLSNSGGKDTFLVKYNSSGQAVWATSIGGSSNELGTSVITDTLGNVYVTGGYTSNSVTINSFGSVSGGTINVSAYGTLSKSGSADVFLVKYNSSGQAIWATNIGGSSYDLGDSVITDTLGNVYVSGVYSSNPVTINSFGSVSGGTINVSPFGTLSNLGDYDVFLVKYNSSGQAVWATNIGASSDLGVGNSMITDTFGNVYVTRGYTSNPVTINSFGSVSEGTINVSPYGTLSNLGDEDTFLVKYNSSGQAVWATSIGGSSSDFGISVITDTFGNVYITGSYSSNPVTINSFGSVSGGTINVSAYGTFSNLVSPDAFLVKYNSSGQVLWATNIGLANANSLCIDKQNNIYLTGDYSGISFNGDPAVINSFASSPTSPGGEIGVSLFGKLAVSATGDTNAYLVKYV